jgi:hypothetical protein
MSAVLGTRRVLLCECHVCCIVSRALNLLESLEVEAVKQQQKNTCHMVSVTKHRCDGASQASEAHKTNRRESCPSLPRETTEGRVGVGEDSGRMNSQIRSVDAARTSQAADEVGLHHRAVVAVIMTA